MYILLGHSIENGMAFIGPFQTEEEAIQVDEKLSFNEEYEELCIHYKHWNIIKLIDLDTMNNGHYFDKTGQGSAYLSQVW